jgi:hypothetical protein
MLVVQNVPITLVDFKNENSPFAEIDYMGAGSGENPEKEKESALQKTNYLESLNDYFKLKNKYESDVREEKRKIFRSAPNKPTAKKLIAKLKPKCVNCKRPVGTIFSLKDEHYTAICGDANLQTKCNLNIHLYRGGFSYEESLLYLFKEQVDVLKEKIIQQKLNTLFSYVSEKESALVFKKELEDYNFDSAMYKTLLENHDELYFNPQRKQLVSEKIERVYEIIESIKTFIEEYKTNGNKETLRDAVRMQIRELIPEIENLRRLKHDVTEVDVAIEEGGNFANPTISAISSLVQKDVHLSKLDFNFGEPSRVIKYVRKGK